MYMCVLCVCVCVCACLCVCVKVVVVGRVDGAGDGSHCSIGGGWGIVMVGLMMG